MLVTSAMPFGSARLAVTAERPFLTEADVENEHDGASFVTGRRRTWESRAEGHLTPTPTCLYTRTLQGCWSRDFPSVHEHSEDDFICVLTVKETCRKPDDYE